MIVRTAGAAGWGRAGGARGRGVCCHVAAPRALPAPEFFA